MTYKRINKTLKILVPLLFVGIFPQNDRIAAEPSDYFVSKNGTKLPVSFLVLIHARYLLECDILTSLQLQGRPVFCFRAQIALLSVGDTVSLRPPPPLVCFYAFLPPPSLFSLEAGDSRRY